MLVAILNFSVNKDISDLDMFIIEFLDPYNLFKDAKSFIISASEAEISLILSIGGHFGGHFGFQCEQRLH